MAASDRPAGVTLSLLDRLTDDEPNSSQDSRSNAWEDMREFKAALCRDISALLNTRRAEEDFDPAFEQASNSVLTFGVTDFTSYNLTNALEQERVRRSIERALRRFEPRLTGVTVLTEQPDPLKPTLKFQIDAFLRTDPAMEPVLLDVTMHRDSRRISVSGANA